MVGLAIGPLGGGPIETRGELRESRAWSTMKVPMIVAAIATGRADWDAIDAAITRSDNDAALLLWHGLDDGAAQVETVLRAAGDHETRLMPFKGGWGPSGSRDGGYEVIQVGIAGPTVIAVAARGGLRGGEAASLEACAATSERSITSTPLPPRTRSARPRSSTCARSAASRSPRRQIRRPSSAPS